MRRIDFYKLSREKQERFLASTRGSAPPAPIAKTLGDGGRGLRWGALSLACLVALVAIYTYKFGALGTSLALHGIELVVVYVGLLFAIPYAALRALGSLRAGKMLPYKPGVYVFPMCAVDARRKVLGVYAMTDLASSSAATAGGALVLSFKGGGSFSFPARDAADAELLNNSLDNAREQVKHALATSDDSELVTLDPFYEARKSWTSPIGPKQPLVDRAPTWHKRGWMIAAACGLVVGPALWSLHNKTSDDVMLKKAVALGTPESLGDYLARGHRHHDEVANVLLPRAQLERAKSKQTVEAIEEFLASHPHSAIDGEAQGALREAMLRELDKAKKDASLAALATFEKKYPDNHLGPELAAARRELYAAAVARFKTMAPSESETLAAFIARLAKALETHGPTLTVAFHREISPALAQADKLMAHLPTNRAFGPTQVTKYFDETPDPQEAQVVAALQKSLERLFSPDLIELKMSPPLDDAAQAALAAKQPLLVVRYRFGWLGVAFPNYQIKRAFAGVNVSGDASFELPDGAAPYRIRLDVPPPRTVPMEYKAKHDGLTAPPADETSPEAGVYKAEDLRALDHITTIIENALLKPAAEK
ncbi:MAG TPA: hypothetical protein VGH28_26520 [Polyangiaceae bacterium]